MTSTSTYARTELVRTQILWTEAVLNPNPDGRARAVIRESFENDGFRALVFYAIGKHGYCYAKLVVSLDDEAHQHRLQIVRRVKVSVAWQDRVAPDLRVMVEQFSGLVERFKFRIHLSLSVKPGTGPKWEGQRPTRITWAPGQIIGLPPRLIGSLEELAVDYVLSDSLSLAAEPVPASRSGDM
jgi:hypothetical protein